MPARPVRADKNGVLDKHNQVGKVLGSLPVTVSPTRGHHHPQPAGAGTNGSNRTFPVMLFDKWKGLGVARNLKCDTELKSSAYEVLARGSPAVFLRSSENGSL